MMEPFLLAPLATAAAPRGFPMNQLVLFGLMFAIFYFLLIAPMRKKQKKHTEMIQALKPGDRVITNGGIHGTVVGVADHVVQVRIADQVKIELSRSAVASLNQDGGD